MELSDVDYTCPKCGQLSFRRFIQPGNKSLGSHVGYCPECGYQMSIVEFESRRRQLIFHFTNSRTEQSLNNAGTQNANKGDTNYYVSKNYAQGCNENSNLFQYLAGKFGMDKVANAFHKYGVETCLWRHREFASIFWYKDSDCTNLAYRIMQYHKDGHSNKRDTITKSLDVENHNRYCLFGRHLLELPDAVNKPVCIVESEKTAIICSIVYPQAIWMATGSSYYLFDNKLDFEPDREIVLIPDPDVKNDLVNDWYQFSKKKGSIYNIRTSCFIDNYVEKNKKNLSFDIADYILENFDSTKANNNVAPLEDIL